MTRFRWALLLAGVLLLASAVAGVAQPRFGHAATTTSTKTITVTGNGSVTTVPDRAGFDFTVDTRGATAKAALAENSTAAAAVVAAVKNAGVADADIQTSQVSLSPQTNQDGTQIVGYSASTSISVKSTIARAGSIVDAAVAAGADGVSGPSLSISDQDAQYRDALQKAVAAAHAKAQTLADAAGHQPSAACRRSSKVPRSTPCRSRRRPASRPVSRSSRARRRSTQRSPSPTTRLDPQLASALERQASLRPLAPRAGIELPFPAVKPRTMKHDARRDAGAAVGDEVAVRDLGLRLGPRSIERPGDAARRIVDRIRLAAPPKGRPRIDEPQRRVGQAPDELVGRDRVAGPLKPAVNSAASICSSPSRSGPPQAARPPIRTAQSSWPKCRRSHQSRSAPPSDP